MQRLPLTVAIAGATLLFAGQSFAAGYYVDEQSALRLGDAFSGGAASASDAAAAYYGPASLILVPDQLTINAAVLPVTSKFSGQSLTLDATGTGVQPVTGGQAKTSTVDVLPTLYFSHHLDENLAIGAYINAPYATGSKFGKTSQARYQAADSELLGIDFGVSVALRVHQKLTLGGGIIMQYMKATTGVAVNTDAICVAELAASCSLGSSGLATSDNDGYFEMKGHQTAAGFQLGALFEFSPHSRLGINYRSKINHSIAGQATASFPSNDFTNLADLAGDYSAAGRVELNTPEVANLSYFHEWGKLSLQADASWTNWSRFKELAVASNDPVIQSFTANPQRMNWSESYRLALGGAYAVSPSLQLRAGLAFDKSPIKDEFTKADFAFDDYKALSVGMSYGFTNALFIDAGLQHTFKQKRQVDNNELAGSAAWLKGEVTTEVTSMALGLRWLL